MDNRPDSIKHLFEMLKDRPSLKDKIQLNNDKLTIILANHYKIDVILKGGFLTYINDSFDYNIEEQDIVDFLIDIAENNYYIIEKKNVKVTESNLHCYLFFPREKFMILSEKEFNKRKDKLLRKANIKIFNHDEIIYET